MRLDVAGGGLAARLARGIAANVLGQVLGLATRLLLVPLFLATWGVDVYGDWLLLTSLVAYLSIADLGAQLYIVNRATQEHARHNLVALRRVIHSGLVLFLVVPAAVLVAFGLLVLMLNPAELIGIQHTSSSTAAVVLMLMAIQLLLTLPYGLLIGIYRAVGLLPSGVMLGNVVLLIQLVATAGALRLGAGMAQVAVLQVVPFVLVSIFALLDLSRRFPELGLFSVAEARLSTIREFVRPSLHFLFIQLSYALSIQGITLVVGLLLGSAELVVFSTLRTMVNSMRQLLAMAAHTAWPEMTRLDAVQDRSHLLALFRVLIRSSMVVSLLSIVALHFFGQLIYSVWLRNSVEFRQDLLDLFLLYVVQAVFWTACSNVLMAVNAHHIISRVLVASAVLSVALALLGGRLDGLQGVIVGMIAADVLLPLWVVPYLLHRYERSFSAGFFVEEAVPVLLALGSLFLAPLALPIVGLLLLLWWLQCLLPTIGVRPWRYGR